METHNNKKMTMNHLAFNKPFLGLFLAFWVVFFLSCHLKELEDNLKAKFEVRDRICEAPCDPGFLNQSANAQAYIWVFGDGKPNGADETPSHVYDVPGDYKAFLVAIGKDGRRDTSSEITIKIVAPGAVGAKFKIVNDSCSAPPSCTIGFLNESLNYNNSVWDFGDSSAKSNENNPTHIYEKAGIYPCTLIVSKNNMKDTMIKNVTILSSVGPSSCFSASQDSCYAPCNITFTNCSSNGASYVWDFGDGSPFSTEKDPSHLYNLAEVYTVKLVVKDASGQKSSTSEKTIRIKPHTYKTSLAGQDFDGYGFGAFSITDSSMLLFQSKFNPMEDNSTYKIVKININSLKT